MIKIPERLIVGVTGYTGNVGRELVRRGAVPLKCDVRDKQQIRDAIGVVNPDVIIHCAGITDVKKCETYYQEAFNVNVRGALNVTDEFDGLFIYISTDHIFPGKGVLSRKNGYGENDRPIPINRYGMIKLSAEEALLGWRISDGKTLIVRTSKLFTKAYLGAMELRILKKEPLEVTGLIYRSFLHVKHFVDGLIWLVENNNKLSHRIINISGTEIVSYYNFYKDFCILNGLSTEYLIERKHKLTDIEPRPFRAGLDVSLARSLGVPLFSYKDGLKIKTLEIEA